MILILKIANYKKPLLVLLRSYVSIDYHIIFHVRRDKFRAQYDRYVIDVLFTLVSEIGDR